MAMTRTKDERVMIGVSKKTKRKFDALVAKLNKANIEANGDKARKIKQEEVLIELIEAYKKVG